MTVLFISMTYIISSFCRLDLSNNDLSRIPTNCLTQAAAANLVELDLSGNSIPAISISDFVQRFRVTIRLLYT